MSSPGNSEQIKAHLQEQFGLSTEQVEDLLPLFLKTLNGHLMEVEAALEVNDLERLGKSAHTIKGALLNLGLNDSAERAKVIELLVRAGNESADYASKIAELRAGLNNYLG